MSADGLAGGLDPVIHAPARLRIIATLDGLRPGDSLSFTRLQELLTLTAGNLLTHLRKLEEAGYLIMAKTPRRRGSETSVELTAEGRAAFVRYRAALRLLLEPVAVNELDG